MLRVGGSNLLKYVSSPSSIAGPVGVNKIGVAATEEDSTLSEEEKLHRLQVAKIVATLSPEEVLEQQQVVFRHVEEQQVADNLTDQEATKLLIETLEHNGLPVPASLLDTPHTENTNLGSNILDSNQFNSNLLTKATEIVTSLISPSSDAPSQEATLPEAGTWQHTLMLNLF